MRILIVQPDLSCANLLKRAFTKQRYETVVTHSGEDAFFLISNEQFDLMLLDITLPGRSGLQILAGMRTKGIITPVLVLAASESAGDRKTARECGATDYIVKPVALPDLLFTMRALVGRERSDRVLRLSLGDLDMDIATRRVTRGRRRLQLTRIEFDILECLLRHAHRLVLRGTLSDAVWKNERRTPSRATVDSHIANLRRKLCANHSVKLLHTIPGRGFVLSDAPVF